MATKCYSVRLERLVRISPKAYKAVAFDGSSDIIPASQVFGPDADVCRSEAWWISAWILSRKSIQYSAKKEAWFSDDGKMLPSYKVERFVPEQIDPIQSNEIQELKR